MAALMARFTDIVHVLAMLAWALGLPLLFWHRWPRLSLAYTLYALLFVAISQLSYWALGECFLTTLARMFWVSAGDSATGTFTIRLVNWVAGIRPSARSAVIAWETGIVITALGAMWSTYRHSSRRTPRAGQRELHSS